MQYGFSTRSGALEQMKLVIYFQLNSQLTVFRLQQAMMTVMA
jgi:hypothetical protein